MTTKPEVPTSGGSYVRKPDGSLDLDHATEQLPTGVPVPTAPPAEQPAAEAPAESTSEEN